MRYQLSSPQVQFYHIEKISDGAAAIITGSVVCDGNGNKNSILAAIRRIYSFNDALRIRLIEAEIEPMQEILEERYDLFTAKCMTFDSKDEMERYSKKIAKEKMSLEGQLCQIIGVRIQNKQFGFIIRIHRIVGDSCTAILACKQFFDFYYNLENGLEVKNKENSFSTYLNNLELYRKSENYIHDQDYWKKQYEICDIIPKFPIHLDKKTSERTIIKMEKETAEQLKMLCKKKDLTFVEAYSTAICIYQCRRNRTNMCSLGTEVANRTSVSQSKTMGAFANIIPLYIRFDVDSNFINCVKQFRSTLNEAKKHQNYICHELIREENESLHYIKHIFDIYVSCHNIEVEGYETTWYYPGQQFVPIIVTISQWNHGTEYLFIYDCMEEVMGKDKIEAFHNVILAIMQKGLM